MRFDELDDLNIALFAAKFYENPEVSSIDEFHEDLNRTKYIKRLFRKYKQTGVLRERLVLNHLIIIFLSTKFLKEIPVLSFVKALHRCS